MYPHKFSKTATLILLLSFGLTFWTCDPNGTGGCADSSHAKIVRTLENGGVIPCNLSLENESFSGGDQMWEISGPSINYSANGSSTSYYFSESTANGDYVVALEVVEADSRCIDEITLEIFDYSITQAMVVFDGCFTVPDSENPVQNCNVSTNGDADYDDENRKLYYTGSIYRSEPNGRNPELIVDDPAYALAVSGSKGLIFYSVDTGNNLFRIFRMNLEGSERDIYFETDDGLPRYLVIAEDQDRLFWSFGSGGPSFIFSGSLSGGFDESSSYGLFPEFLEIHALAYDNDEGHLYFAAQYVGSPSVIYRVNIGQQEPEAEVFLDKASDAPILAMDIDEKDNFLYWTDQEEAVVRRADLVLPGQVIEVVATDITNPRSLAVGNFR